MVPSTPLLDIKLYPILFNLDIVARTTFSLKESVSKAFSGNKSYLTNTFILKFNNAFDNMFNNDWLMEGKGEMLKNNQSIGDIKNSSVHGVNVNGKDIHLECPFDKNGMEIIVNMINQNQKNIEMFQEQINRLITLLEKKYN